MNNDTALVGAVAALLNERELAINLGRAAGVREGMRFQVLEKAKPIVDPISNEELGTVQREKVKVKVVEVHDKFAIARTYETYQTHPTLGSIARRVGLGLAWAATDDASDGETRVRTLRTADKPDGFGEINEARSYVQVGDPVQLIEEAEALPQPTSRQKTA